MEITRRFLKYVSFDTTSSETSDTVPTTAHQRVLGQYLADELAALGLEGARLRGRRCIVAAGGVAANTIIRGDLERACEKAGYRLYLPPLSLCGDNGAMIGAQGYYEYLAGRRAGLDLNAYATMELDDLFY